VNHIEDAEHVAEELRSVWQADIDSVDDLTELLEAQGTKIGLADGDVHFDAHPFWVNDQSPVIANSSPDTRVGPYHAQCRSSRR